MKAIIAISVVFFIAALGLALNIIDRQSGTNNTGGNLVSSISANITNQPTITLDVAGAVKRPGVYLVPINSRVEQAIVMAGGFEESIADKDFIAWDLNLAAKVSDGQKIYILRRGEDKSKVPSLVSAYTSSQNKGKININLASQSELESLSGVGPVTALKIINARPYSTLNDLVAKKIISATIYSKIASNLTAQ